MKKHKQALLNIRCIILALFTYTKPGSVWFLNSHATVEADHNEVASLFVIVQPEL